MNPPLLNLYNKKLELTVTSVTQVIFEHEGVFIHPGTDEDGIEQDLLVSGSLRIVDKVKRCIRFVYLLCVSLWFSSVELE